MIKVGLQIPNFTYPDTAPGELFEKVAAVAVAAEDAGADTVMVMDHFYQLPLLGPTDHEMFEAYTLLGALAARTKRVKLGTLVTGVTYRNPAILAKIVTTLDVVSSGPGVPRHRRRLVRRRARGARRAVPAGEGALRAPRGGAAHLPRHVPRRAAHDRGQALLGEGRHQLAGSRHAGGPPIMIGGQGEKKTLRLMAEHAEMANFTSGFDELPRKLEVLAGHCATVGRDIAARSTRPRSAPW